MGKKIFSVLGMICGVVVIILGILMTKGSFGGNTSLAGSAPYSYDTGYAKFGADFYTYVSNNAADAAKAAHTTADNLRGIATLLEDALGIFLMAFGAFMFCLFGTKLTGTPRVKTAPATPEPAVQPLEADELHPVVEAVKENCLGACEPEDTEAAEEPAPIPEDIPENE